MFKLVDKKPGSAEFLSCQIEKKSRDLECPVCLETSETPIYMCSEQHIICSNCWQKVCFSNLLHFSKVNL